VLTKTDELFRREAKARKDAAASLERLAAREMRMINRRYPGAETGLRKPEAAGHSWIGSVPHGEATRPGPLLRELCCNMLT
jgi:hypothetical protein